MQQDLAEIVILKPTRIFLSFLASQLPQALLPDLKQLQIDNTAYVIRQRNSDEATLDEIEKSYALMFRHEMRRWLGNDARNAIEGSFLDFLCCFKFELHSHIVLIESSINKADQVLIVKPRTVLLNWIKSAVEDDEELVAIMERVSLSQISENATVIVKNFDDLKKIKPFLTRYYKPIFEAAMRRMSNQSNQWPVINSFQSFNEYFAIEIHTQLIHLNH